MNQNEINRKFDELTAQADELASSLEEQREHRNDLLRKRFDLKEQRRYFRTQLREAESEENPARAAEVQQRLEEIMTQLEKLEAEINMLEKEIDTDEDRMDAVVEQLEHLKSSAKTAGGASDAAQTDWITGTAERVNQFLQKGFQRMTDTLENLDLNQLGENVHAAASKTAKTVGAAASDAAKSVGRAWREVKENRDRWDGDGDYRVAGSSGMNGGTYNRISVSGSCRVSGDLDCRELKVSGSFRASGDLDCSGPARVTGSLQCAGKLRAESLVSSGAVKVQGTVDGGSVTVSGSLQTDGDLRGSEVRSAGKIQVSGDVEADSFTSMGSLHVGGMINAEHVHIVLCVGQNEAGDIGGSTVEIVHHAPEEMLSGVLKPVAATLTCDSIEGDNVVLHGVKARVVRGTAVDIHSDCDIGRVEYTGTCTIEEGAKVGECIRL